MSYKDYYQVLGIARDASTQDLQKAYRALARRFHPDVSKEPDAEVRFKEIGEAYEVLKDPEKRALYDKWGQHWKAISEGRQPPRGGPGSSEAQFDFNSFDFGSNVQDLRSIFESVFAGAAPPRGRRRRRTSTMDMQGDQETILELPVSFAYVGGKRDIQFNDAISGERRRLTVTVPAQVRDGQRIRLANQAAGGMSDLFLVVRLKGDARFHVEGDDLVTRLKITPAEAVLGATAALETLDGRVKVKVPPGSSTGRRIRLRERGYPGRGERRGDLYAEIQIVVPDAPSDEEKALYEKLQSVSTFDPRE